MRTLSMRCALTFTLTVAAGCASPGVPERPPPAAPPDDSGAAGGAGTGRIVAPVTYGNRLPWPCADCPSLHLTVTLFPDSTFRLRQVYQDRPAAAHSLGRWSVAENGTRLVLRSGARAPPQLFEIVGVDSLRMLDSLGRPTKSPLHFSLGRAPQADPVRDTMRLLGMYMYMADAGRFTECLSGATFPVAQVGANAALERAYGQAQTAPGAPLLVSVRGHFEERPAMEGDRRMEYVVVDSFDRVRSGTCEEPTSSATLENTYWKLLDLGGQPARVAENIAEPHLLLNPAENQARGSTGCNRFMGPYELSGDSVRLGPLGSTRRACLDPEMNRQESAFLGALGETRTWRITGDTLILTGVAGRVTRFAAVYLR